MVLSRAARRPQISGALLGEKVEGRPRFTMPTDMGKL